MPISILISKYIAIKISNPGGCVGYKLAITETNFCTALARFRKVASNFTWCYVRACSYGTLVFIFLIHLGRYGQILWSNEYIHMWSTYFDILSSIECHIIYTNYYQNIMTQ